MLLKMAMLPRDIFSLIVVSTLHRHLILILVFLHPSLVVQYARGAAVPSSADIPGFPACDEKHRDPCTTFPGLCSTGGGLCVLKGPCEYECVCPPDGRRGRNCMGNDDVISPPNEEFGESSRGGSLLNSLLVFPQDLFWDLNHVMRPEEAVKMIHSTPPPDTFYSEFLFTTPSVPSNPLKSTDISLATMSDTASITPHSKNVLMGVPVTTTSLPTSSLQPKQSLGLDPGQRNNVLSVQTTTPTPSTIGVDVTTKIYISTSPAVEQPFSPTTTGSTSNRSTNSVNEDVTIPNAFPVFGETAATSGNQDGANTLTSTITPNNVKLPTNSVTKPNLVIMTQPTTTHSSSTQTPTSDPSSLPSTPTGIVSGIKHPVTISQISTPSAMQILNDVMTSTSETLQKSLTNDKNSLWNILSPMTTTTNSIPSSQSTGLREMFPGHESFPTFFRDVVEEDRGKQEDGPPNAAMSKRVHRVFFPIPQFEIFKRRRDG